jgi:hypothetical protein
MPHIHAGIVLLLDALFLSKTGFEDTGLCPRDCPDRATTPIGRGDHQRSAKIAHGAMSMVETALKGLSERGIVELEDGRKAAMVSNLLVVLC